MNLRSQLAALVALAVVTAGGWHLWEESSTSGAQSSVTPRKGPQATRVLVEPAIIATDKVTIRAVGTGEALRSAMIYPKVSGEVTSVQFRAQDRVKENDVLLRLDDTHQRIAVRLARVAVKDANRQLKRLEKLAPSGTASQARLETAQTLLESNELRLDQAEQELDDRVIYAPFDGIIGLTEIDRGDRVNPETAIATLDNRTHILVEFDLPEAYADSVRIGDSVTVTPWTQAGQSIQGEIAQLGSRIDEVSRTLQAKARIPNSDDTIRPGTSFAVEMNFTGRAYPSVREVAVLWSRDGAYLWRVGQSSKKADKNLGKAEKVFVKIVRRDRGRILVDGPLNAGDSIVVEGVQGLRQGQLLKAEPLSGKSPPPETSSK